MPSNWMQKSVSFAQCCWFLQRAPTKQVPFMSINFRSKSLLEVIRICTSGTPAGSVTMRVFSVYEVGKSKFVTPVAETQLTTRGDVWYCTDVQRAPDRAHCNAKESSTKANRTGLREQDLRHLWPMGHSKTSPRVVVATAPLGAQRTMRLIHGLRALRWRGT